MRLCVMGFRGMCCGRSINNIAWLYMDLHELQFCCRVYFGSRVPQLDMNEWSVDSGSGCILQHLSRVIVGCGAYVCMYERI